MASLQITLDTNVVVAALRSKGGASYKLLSLIGTDTFDINLSVPLLFEYEDILLRQRKTLGLTKTDIADFLDYLCATANLHEVFFLWRPSLKDPNDEMVLELAVTAGCDYIITYNKRDFRGVETFGIETLTAKEFLQTIEEIS